MRMKSSWNTLLLAVQTGIDTEENSWQFLIKVNIYLPCDPAILLLGIYPKELKTYIHSKTWIQTFIAVLLKLSKKYWKQPRCPWLDKWINQLWYINTLECYWTIKRGTLLLRATTWADMKGIVVSEQDQSQKIPDLIVPFM